jgi:MFS family permease
VGESVNSIGSWASAVVLWGFAAYRFNAGPHAVSLLIVCWAAPTVVFGPVLGVVVDRVGAQRALIIAYLAGTLTALGMAIAGTLAQLDLTAILYGATRALANPAAGALPPRVIRADDLLAANSLLGVAGRTGQILGPLVASLTLALAGFRAAFVLDAVTYLCGAAVVAPLPLLPLGDRPRAGWWTELREGLSIVRRRPALRVVFLLGLAVTFTSGAFLVVEPLYARHVLHRPPSQFALFEAAAGTGAVLAGLALPHVRARLSGLRHLALAGSGYGLTACLFIGTTWVPVAYAGAFFWGMTGAVFSALALTSLQQLAPTHTHGRVMALNSTLQSAADAIGLPLAGAALAAFTIRPGAVALAAVAMVAGVTALVAVPALPEEP